MSGNHYLLVTHTLIWFQENNPKIPSDVLKIIQNPENIIFFSQVSLFEIGIKQKIGKLPSFYASLEEVYLQGIEDGFTFLSIQNQHLFAYLQIPLMESHRDPFDRLLISTATTEKAAILTADKTFRFYNDIVEVIW